MSGKLLLLPEEVYFFISNFFNDGKLEEEKSADVIVLTKVSKEGLNNNNFEKQGGVHATSIAENIVIKFREMATYKRIRWKQKNM